jgi:Glycosyltransferase Family 4
MDRLRVLITNTTLSHRSGTELYVRDLAVGLLRRGHAPVVYTPDRGGVADEIRAATVPVVDDLRAVAEPPDVIHGHHAVETVTALLRCAGVPAVFVCHDRLAWHDAPPRFGRIRRYVAVDENCRDRLVLEHGIPPDEVRVHLNWVDLDRFRPRPPLPGRPGRALVFGSPGRAAPHLPAVRSACEAAGLGLDVLGTQAGPSRARPEDVLGDYDLVFATARCALEALAVGAAVVLCDARGAGPLVTAGDFDRLRRLNFGRRALVRALRPDVLAEEIARYDAADAAEVSQRARATAGMQAALDEWLSLYREVIAEGERGACTWDEERQAAADFLGGLAYSRYARAAAEACQRRAAEYEKLAAEHQMLAAEHERLAAEHQMLEARRERLAAGLAALRGSAGVRLHQWLRRRPLLGPSLRALRQFVSR